MCINAVLICSTLLLIPLIAFNLNKHNLKQIVCLNFSELFVYVKIVHVQKLKIYSEESKKCIVLSSVGTRHIPLKMSYK